MDLSFVFESSDHLRYENGKLVSGPHGRASRLIKVESSSPMGQFFTVSIYNLDGNQPIWQNNVQMAPKEMMIILNTDDKVILRGFGWDSMGSSYSDYGLTIHFENQQVIKCILHMYDRNIDIEYLP